MALYELHGDGLTPIVQSTFTSLGLLERSNIQRAVRKQIAAITPGVRTMVLAEEFSNWVDANRRIDLLCLDETAQLVIVELKRDNSGHMELQALRYAAMVSTMTFDMAVDAHAKYLRANGSDGDAAQAIREFLDAEDRTITFEGVRIVLAASEFSTELTTAVLWLNERGIDIRCVQMCPHAVDDRVLLDIQQLIPLPAAETYQVALREKSIERAAARTHSRDVTRYDFSVGESTRVNLPKRRFMYELVTEVLRRGVEPERVAAAVPWREGTMFISAEGKVDEAGLRSAFPGKSLDRYFIATEELFEVSGRTYAFSNQWGTRFLEAVGNILALMPDGIPVAYQQTTPVVDEVSYDGYLIRRRESGTIELERDGRQIDPVKPALRELASKLNVLTSNGRGNEMNTQQLGARVIRTISDLYV